MIRSNINPQPKHTPSKNEIYINSEDLVLKCLEVMIQHKQFKLPIYTEKRCTGEVHLGDLINFLGPDQAPIDNFVHKLNFTVESAIVRMIKMSQGY